MNQRISRRGEHSAEKARQERKAVRCAAPLTWQMRRRVAASNAANASATALSALTALLQAPRSVPLPARASMSTASSARATNTLVTNGGGGGAAPAACARLRRDDGDEISAEALP